MGRKIILGQLKDYSDKLQRSTVRNVIAKFKSAYNNPKYNGRIAGFELCGGPDMSRGAWEEWNDFEDWCEERGMFAQYLNQSQLDRLEHNLICRLDLINDY